MRREDIADPDDGGNEHGWQARRQEDRDPGCRRRRAGRAHQPLKAIEEAGATTELLSLEAGEILGFDHLDHGDRFPVDKAVGQASVDDYDGLLIPGGVASGAFCAPIQDVVRFVADFARSGKPIASICHGPPTLVASRRPDDIPAFSARAIEQFADGVHQDLPQRTSATAA
jgi:putative intracellular protease/amidase